MDAVSPTIPIRSQFAEPGCIIQHVQRVTPVLFHTNQLPTMHRPASTSRTHAATTRSVTSLTCASTPLHRTVCSLVPCSIVRMAPPARNSMLSSVHTSPILENVSMEISVATATFGMQQKCEKECPGLPHQQPKQKTTRLAT